MVCLDTPSAEPGEPAIAPQPVSDPAPGPSFTGIIVLSQRLKALFVVRVEDRFDGSAEEAGDAEGQWKAGVSSALTVCRETWSWSARAPWLQPWPSRSVLPGRHAHRVRLIRQDPQGLGRPDPGVPRNLSVPRVRNVLCPQSREHASPAATREAPSTCWISSGPVPSHLDGSEVSTVTAAPADQRQLRRSDGKPTA
jgi:hypothetical protein